MGRHSRKGYNNLDTGIPIGSEDKCHSYKIKTKELSTLCGVEACAIVYDPKDPG
ncbi:hypothetical protein JHK84_032002 [Glycine max]|nr:hypothetical protein JHK85_032428 [Glycine max]KAG4995034.1 hypothetical protein JHK86_031861 [Glycine max]KAG5146459.1 hypothetical protein JHK84_032002 [Glycine max]